jgi:hypothetical protein
MTFSHSVCQQLNDADRLKSEYVWTVPKSRPFDELILSWNGLRPEEGKWSFWVSLRQGEWSAELPYAEWSCASQKTFEAIGPIAKSYQDGVFPLQGDGEGFRVIVRAEEGADLSQLQELYVCLSSLSDFRETEWKKLPSVKLEGVPKKSQIALNHERSIDLCSPTSSSVAIGFFGKAVDPASFAAKVRDAGFDIYGNWTLNTAQICHELGGQVFCKVQRLNNFQELHSFLTQGLPVIVSVRGPLAGSARAYKLGHLICVIGYDSDLDRVLCIDPAFPTDAETEVSYDRSDFIQAWGRRKNIAYVFRDLL